MDGDSDGRGSHVQATDEFCLRARLRKRYRALLREETGQTVSAPAEVDAELRHLLAVIAS